MLLHELFEYHARENPHGGGIRCGASEHTYAELEALANRLARALLAAGIAPGDRIAILSRNRAEVVVAYLGAAKAGAVLVPMNYRLAPPEWKFILEDSEARLLIAAGDLVAAVTPVADAVPALEVRVAIEARSPRGWCEWDDWLAAQPDSRPRLGIDGATPLFQMYTSGTTGRPKGAVLNHHQALCNILQLQLALDFGFLRGDRVLVVPPLYHIAGTQLSLGALVTGGNVLLHETFVAEEVVRALSEEAIQRVTLVPVMIQACLEVPGVAERRYPKLRAILYGAAPIAVDVLRRAMETFHCDFAQGFGMTETGTTAVLTAADHRRAVTSRPELLQSCGRPMPGTLLRIVDAEGNDVPVGTVGEIVVRGPQVMSGYWNRPEANAEALRGRWMHTGDAGAFDSEGYLYLHDRLKDMIVTGGENVYSLEVERVLREHLAIADAAVFGVPDPKWGESVMAVVVARAGERLDPEEVRRFCRERLAGYKVPRRIVLVDEVPRNASGKVLKSALREPYRKGQTRSVS
jgi:fatty-acyl-CoA synthase